MTGKHEDRVRGEEKVDTASHVTLCISKIANSAK